MVDSRKRGFAVRSKRSVGAYGSKRWSNPTEKKQRVRSTDERITGALAKARKADAELEARMREEQEATRYIPMPEVPKTAPEPVSSPPLRVERRARARPTATQTADPVRQRQWPLGDARQLLRDGYKMAQVMRMTGWPEHMLKD